MSDIRHQLEIIRDQISTAARQSGRSSDAIKLLAVSKTYASSIIEKAYAEGQVLFGENRVQELLEKVPQLPSELQWHLIGHLQKNKIRKILPLIHTIHSIDSLSIADSVNRIAGELNLKIPIYLQVNISHDQAKFGFPPADAPAALDHLQNLPHLQIQGLMTIPEYSADPEQTRPHFASLRDLRNQLKTSSGLPLPGLSMGMSHDYPIAIQEGATIIRVGSALFGKR
ncbi:MAG: YggS family pyridoxal phosphate-dependent enzyme [Verrucomicrobiales bacterium]|nr:YggS family pyridoxal phosphate-dependent enzyme [Verrucomicrobiales bacterium]